MSSRGPAGLARRFVEHPGAGNAVVRTLEAVGAHTVADHVDRVRSGGDLVPVTLPANTRDLRGHRFRMHSLEDRDQVVRALRTGGWLSFEAPLPSVLVRLARRWPGTFLDVGANTGFYSLLAVAAHRKVRSIAFEPVPEIVALLEANVGANPQGDRITVRPIAISDRTGEVALHLPPAQADGTVETSASLDPGFKESIARVVTVPGETLDQAWRTAGQPDVPLVKVDVEGAEPLVLAGADELIDACRPVITLEILGAADTSAAERLRSEHRYVDVTLHPREAVVNRPEVTSDPLAPNHLFVPWERLGAVVEELHLIPRLVVTLLD